MENKEIFKVDLSNKTEKEKYAEGYNAGQAFTTEIEKNLIKYEFGLPNDKSYLAGFQQGVLENKQQIEAAMKK